MVCCWVGFVTVIGHWLVAVVLGVAVKRMVVVRIKSVATTCFFVLSTNRYVTCHTYKH